MNITTAIRELIRATFRENDLRHHTKGNRIFASVWAHCPRYSTEYYGRLIVNVIEAEAVAEIEFFTDDDNDLYRPIFAKYWVVKYPWMPWKKPLYHQWKVTLELSDPEFVDKLSKICNLIPTHNKYPDKCKPMKFDGHQNFIRDVVSEQRYFREHIYQLICSIIRKFLCLPGVDPSIAWYHACWRLGGKKMADDASSAVDELRNMSEHTLNIDSVNIENEYYRCYNRLSIK